MNNGTMASPSPASRRSEAKADGGEGRGLSCRSTAKADEGELNTSANSKLKIQNSSFLHSRKSYIVNHKSQEGIALVMTLILLSVTLVMAIAFLAVSRRERGSVTTESDTKTAQFAADAALAQVEARIVANILVTTNPYIEGLLVSTNYYNVNGFTNGSANLLNVNYNYLANPGGSLTTAAQIEQNIANLYYNPRPPVFYTNDFRYYLDLNRNGRYDTNGVVANVDNNLNGLGTTSLQVGDPEWIGVLEHPDQPHGPNNFFTSRFCFIAVPADRLDINYIHNQALDALNGAASVDSPPVGDAYSRNQGVGTWEINLAAFLADLNTNRWDPGLGNFFGLPDEPYTYPELTLGSSVAFDDARSLISWRYGQASYGWVTNVNHLYGPPGDAAFLNNGIDGYSDRRQVTFDTNYAGFDNPNLPWVGAPNTNTFFYSPSELFNPAKSYVQFTNNLLLAGTANSTYDRYTFYRMLAQLGSDSSPESGKVNLNYSNALVTYFTDANGVSVPTSIALVPNAETNFTTWAPLDFFTVAANKMLQAYTAEWYQSWPSNFYQTYYGLTTNYNLMSAYGLTNYPLFGMTNQIPAFGITNIPVSINGQFVYSPAVNRIVQLAANIYDASLWTNNPNTGVSNYPSVFRPIFWKTNEFVGVNRLPVTDVYIRGYQYVVEPLVTNGNPIFTTPVEVNALPFGLTTSNVWGVPWIIGAKKGFPNFNTFEWQSSVFIERELQFTRSETNPATGQFPFGRIYQTNQMYVIGISNIFGAADWNSYAENYQNPVTVVAQDYLSMQLTNLTAGYGITNNVSATGFATLNTGWAARTFVMPYGTNIYFSMPLNAIYPATNNNTYVYYYGNTGTGSANASGVTFTGPIFIPTYLDPSNYLDIGITPPPLPQFVLMGTNRLQAFILDTKNGDRILDYVQLGGMNEEFSINQDIADPNNSGFWSTNGYAGGTMPYGVYEQYEVSQGGTFPSGVDSDEGGGTPAQGWTTAPVPGTSSTSSAAQIAFFQAFFSASDTAPLGNTFVTNFDSSIQAPYTPMRLITQKFVYQANDPLVHYLTSDLYDAADTTNGRVNMSLPPPNFSPPIDTVSDRYSPWGSDGTGMSAGGQVDPNPYNLSYKDPLVRMSDNWDFPTNKYPAVGWIGRVHRGTPWQTIFLKSTNLLALTEQISDGPLIYIGTNTWRLWTGNQNPYDAFNSAPVQDHLLFDLFTTTPDDDATRGQLSVNVGADDPSNSIAGLAAWSAVLSGAEVFSNNVNNAIAGSSFDPPAQDPINVAALTIRQGAITYFPTNIQPAGPFPFSSQLGQIVENINSTRTNFVGIDGLHGVFEHVGDVLAASALSDGSPFLNSANQGQQENEISDEMYEWLPQQAMGLLTISGTPQAPQRYVVYCYGQTLKPAPNGIVTSGSFFGLCTNYQVTAETGARVVIRVENTPTPANPTATPHVVIEQYNPLPPD
jgi:hypothetical protein